MKRVVFLLFLAGCILPACAEQMTFVTTLSSPLGTFAQLETADPSAVSSVPLVNFCNSRSSVGTVTLKGANAYLQTLYLKNATVLGGNTPEYRVENALNVNKDGELTAGRLMADKVTVTGAADAKSNVSDTLYADALTVKGAKTESLVIPGQVETVAGENSTATLEWSNAYPCDYEEVAGPPPSSDYEWTQMVRYNADNGRFENNNGLSTYDTCDGKPLLKYTGTPSSECIDIWLDGSTSSMLYSKLGNIVITETGEGCSWPVPCSQYHQVVPICNARLPQGWQITDGSDIKFALSSSNSSITQDQRWKYYVPKSSQVSQFFGNLKTTYERWLNNGDWSLGHPYTFNVCIQDEVATSKGIQYTLSYGKTSFKASKHLPKQETPAGTVECVSENKYTSYLLKGGQ